MADDFRPRTPCMKGWKETDGGKEWYESRPKIIRDLIDNFPPDRLYRMKDGGDRLYCIVVYDTNDDETEAGFTMFTPGSAFLPIPTEVFDVPSEDLVVAEEEAETEYRHILSLVT